MRLAAGMPATITLEALHRAAFFRPHRRDRRQCPAATRRPGRGPRVSGQGAPRQVPAHAAASRTDVRRGDLGSSGATRLRCRCRRSSSETAVPACSRSAAAPRASAGHDRHHWRAVDRSRRRAGRHRDRDRARFQVLRDLQDGAPVRAATGADAARDRRHRPGRRRVARPIHCVQRSARSPSPSPSRPSSSSRPPRWRPPLRRSHHGTHLWLRHVRDRPGRLTGRVSRRQLQEQLARNPPIRRADAASLIALRGRRSRIYAPNAQARADVVRGGRILEDAPVTGTTSDARGDSAI